MYGSIGMQTSTFGVSGVKEHCYFLKEIDDARALRTAIVAKFEAASLPSLSDQERVSAYAISNSEYRT